MAAAAVKKWVSLGLILAAAGAGAAAAWRIWRAQQVFVSTDDAYVRGHVVTVAARIAGQLRAVLVTENQPVRAGQRLATLDPRDLDQAVRRARARLAEARATLALDRVRTRQARSQVRAAKGRSNLAKAEHRRLAALAERNSAPRQELDQAVAADEVAAASLEQARQQVEVGRGQEALDRSKLRTARTSLDEALLQRGYCTVTAPCAGTVSRRMAEPGMVVAAGEPLLAVVPLGQEDLWVEANYKETQLARVHPGQPVSLRVDLDPTRTYQGTVESLPAGTGSVFSLLPAENATGNWVKVVQRLPVRIRLRPGADPEQRLRLGLSVTSVIDTRER